MRRFPIPIPASRTLRLVAAAVLLATAATVGGCGEDGPTGAGHVLTVTVGGGSGGRGHKSTGGGEAEYRFDVADRVPAGPVRIDLVNRGDEPHHAQVLRLADGRTVDDLTTALATAGPAAALSVGTFVGGTALVAPGESSGADAVLDLDAGEHVLLCFVPDAQGVPHVGHGMVHPFTVTGADADADADQRTADEAEEVELGDYTFDAPTTLDGQATVSVANVSETEAHEMVVAELDDRTTVDDVVRALDAGRRLPARALGGMQALMPGSVERLALDLDPGRYVLFCAVPSPDGAPHYRAGMVEEVRVS